MALEQKDNTLNNIYSAIYYYLVLRTIRVNNRQK